MKRQRKSPSSENPPICHPIRREPEDAPQQRQSESTPTRLAEPPAGAASLGLLGDVGALLQSRGSMVQNLPLTSPFFLDTLTQSSFVTGRGRYLDAISGTLGSSGTTEPVGQLERLQHLLTSGRTSPSPGLGVLGAPMVTLDRRSILHSAFHQLPLPSTSSTLSHFRSPGSNNASGFHMQQQASGVQQTIQTSKADQTEIKRIPCRSRSMSPGHDFEVRNVQP
jgi:hypothetical protein